MKKRSLLLGIILLGLGTVMLVLTVAGIEIDPIVRIIIGIVEIAVGILLLNTTQNGKK